MEEVSTNVSQIHQEERRVFVRENQTERTSKVQSSPSTIFEIQEKPNLTTKEIQDEKKWEHSLTLTPKSKNNISEILTVEETSKKRNISKIEEIENNQEELISENTTSTKTSTESSQNLMKEDQEELGENTTSKESSLETVIERTLILQTEKPTEIIILNKNVWNRSETILLISSLVIGMLLIFLIIASAIKKQTGNVTISQERRLSNQEIGLYEMREIGAQWRNVRKLTNQLNLKYLYF